MYYVLGTSLAEGKGYRLLNEPGEIQANQYPPLLPLIIAAHQLVLGTSDPLVVGRFLRLSSFLVFATYIFAIYTLLRRYLSSAFAFFGTVVCLLNVQTYFLSDLCFPDLLYGLLTVGFLLACSSEGWWLSPAWAGAFAMTAFASRTAGIALFAAWIAEGLVRRQWKTVAIRVAISLVPILGWFSYVHYVETSAEYQRPPYAYQRADYMFYNVSYAKNVSLNDPFDPDLGYSTLSDRVERYFHNVAHVTRYIGESVSSMRPVWKVEWEEVAKQMGIKAEPEWLIDVPLIALGSLVLVGTGIFAAQGHIVVPLCVLSSISVICLTPWPDQFNRYLMPTVPLLALSLCTAIAWVLRQAQRRPPTRWKSVVHVLAYLLVVGILVQQIATTVAVYTKRHLPVQFKTRQGDMVGYRSFFYMDSFRALDGGVDWLMAHTKPHDVIAVSVPHWVYLRTGNKSVMPPFESDPIKAVQLLESVPVTYLILDEGLAIDSKRFMKSVVEGFPDRWKRVYSDDVVTETGARHEQAFEIYEHVRPGSVIVQPETGLLLLMPENARSEKERHEVG
ncbi:MAG: hypothetical protein Q7U39_03570 [Nitrospira sp.]|nr:hypothetical protein [Nitrospira sp.]